MHVQCILKIVARILAMIRTVFRASRTYYENRVARNATRERGGTYFLSVTEHTTFHRRGGAVNTSSFCLLVRPLHDGAVNILFTGER